MVLQTLWGHPVYRQLYLSENLPLSFTKKKYLIYYAQAHIHIKRAVFGVILFKLYKVLLFFFSLFWKITSWRTNVKDGMCAQSHPTFCDPMDWKHQVCDRMDYSPPGSSVHGDSPGKNTRVGFHALLQGSSQSKNWTQASLIAGRFFTNWATREAPKMV